MKAASWIVLSERPPRDPVEPRVTFSRQAKGSPRVFFNLPAAQLLQVRIGSRVEFLAPQGSPGLVLGLRHSPSDKTGCALHRAGRTRSLCLVTSSVPYLTAAYKKITYRPRPGRDGEPEWVLEPLSSEKLPQS